MVVAARPVQLPTAAQDSAVRQIEPQVVPQLAAAALPATGRNLQGNYFTSREMSGDRITEEDLLALTQGPYLQGMG